MAKVKCSKTEAKAPKGDTRKKVCKKTRTNESKRVAKATSKVKAKNPSKTKTPKTTQKATKPLKVEVVLDQAEFCSTLKVAIDFTQKSADLPALSHITLESKGKFCTISATDLDTWWTKKLPFRGSDVKRLIPAEILYKEVKALSSEVHEVVLTFTGSEVSVNGRCKIVTLDADVAPVPAPTVKGEQLQVTALPSLLGHVLVAASTDICRTNLNGVCFNFTKSQLMATDGHRFHYEPIDNIDAPTFTLPIKPASLVVKHKADGVIFVEGNLLKTAIVGGTMVTRLSESEFPDTAPILKGERPIKVNFGTADILKVLEGALPLAEKDKIISIKVNGKLTVSTKNNAGSYSWDIPCTTKGKTENIEFGVNSKYLLDAVKAFSGDKVKLELADATSAFQVNTKAIVMPCRL